MRHTEQHSGHNDKIREAVGLFDNMEELQEAVSDLEVQTFPREFISVMGNRSDITERFGIPVIKPEDAEDDPGAPRSILVRSEEKAVGAGALIGGSAYIFAVAAALVAGAKDMPAILPAVAIGGLVGAAMGAALVKILDNHFNKNINDQIDGGGLLLWVRTPDPEHERLAQKVLKAHGAKHVRVHEIKY